jgi:hypothetical protein
MQVHRGPWLKPEDESESMASNNTIFTKLVRLTNIMQMLPSFSTKRLSKSPFSEPLAQSSGNFEDWIEGWQKKEDGLFRRLDILSIIYLELSVTWCWETICRLEELHLPWLLETAMSIELLPINKWVSGCSALSRFFLMSTTWEVSRIRNWDGIEWIKIERSLCDLTICFGGGELLVVWNKSKVLPTRSCQP